MKLTEISNLFGVIRIEVDAPEQIDHGQQVQRITIYATHGVRKITCHMDKPTERQPGGDV